MKWLKKNKQNIILAVQSAIVFYAMSIGFGETYLLIWLAVGLPIKWWSIAIAYVLVCNARDGFVDTWKYLWNGSWLYDNNFWGTDDVTHWMPLPQPPKGE